MPRIRRTPCTSSGFVICSIASTLDGSALTPWAVSNG